MQLFAYIETMFVVIYIYLKFSLSFRVCNFQIIFTMLQSILVKLNKSEFNITCFLLSNDETTKFVFKVLEIWNILLFFIKINWIVNIVSFMKDHKVFIVQWQLIGLYFLMIIPFFFGFYFFIILFDQITF